VFVRNTSAAFPVLVSVCDISVEPAEHCKLHEESQLIFTASTEITSQVAPLSNIY